MDLETENRLAAMLMREAAELRRQAEQEGVLAYLHKPNVRARPNSRFLTATVRGVQQANRAVEVNEMWRVREKELDLDKRVKGASKGISSGHRSHRDVNSSRSPVRHAAFDNSANVSASCSSKLEYELDEWDKVTSKDKINADRSYRDTRNGYSSRSTGRHGVVDNSTNAPSSCSSKQDHYLEPEGLKDEELEEFLHSRTKRGRGAVGPRMDETGPYLPPRADGVASPTPDVREHRLVYGPERPPSLDSYESSEEELHEERRKKSKKSHSGNSDKHSKKHRSKEKSKHKKKKRDEKRSKHHH